MTYRVVYSADARRGIGTLAPDQRRAVLEAERGPLATRPYDVGTEHEGRGPTALRRLVLDAARVSIGYRVFPDHVEVQVVWIIGHP
ncbi:hypothetical protein ACFP1Z_21620 [Streptomyces gamaensis]|uniref:Type II toxin-antitoxin system RelE/ParE family toxin n=1 Tax=Streptomyces gamaensis TaxID=1763542 RepID=A0ABW0Z2T5_9ACTN